MLLSYCSLDDAKVELVVQNDNQTEGDKLMRFAYQTSHRINQIMNPRRSHRPYFGPYSEALKFPLGPRYVNSYDHTLLLRGAPPLLAISSAVAGTTTITSVLEGYPQGEPFFRQVRITSDGDAWYSYDDGDDPGYLALTGVWGCHSDYANAWLQVGTLVAQIAADATSFTIADIDGDDDYGQPNKISRGHLLRFGTGSDYAVVSATDTGTNTGTVKRNVHGGTGALQAAGTAIYRWEVEEPIRRVTARQAALLYARKGAFQVETLDGVGVITYPQDLLAELRHVLTEYMNG